jgi:hypothetical protein
VRSELLPDRLRVHPNLHADLYQCQSAEVEVSCFVEAGRIEPSTADRHIPTGEVHRDRAAVQSEHGCQLDERRALAVLRHQVVDLLGA